MSAMPVTWFEITGTAPAELQSFYRSLFGWQIDTSKNPEYGTVAPGDGGVPGGIGGTMGAPEGWLTFYVAVPDLQAACDQVASLGGTVVMPPTELPEATIAMILDPEGHRVGLLQAPAQPTT